MFRPTAENRHLSEYIQTILFDMRGSNAMWMVIQEFGGGVLPRLSSLGLLSSVKLDEVWRGVGLSSLVPSSFPFIRKLEISFLRDDLTTLLEFICSFLQLEDLVVKGCPSVGTFPSAINP
ncbi:hypothetical protein L218DRAFT_1007347 [Marasmius fiardii PR-910]|nr:hypothetical protein L218DRAFT_1007347 [Marasmius fiardii PR-910]